MKVPVSVLSAPTPSARPTLPAAASIQQIGLINNETLVVELQGTLEISGSSSGLLHLVGGAGGITNGACGGVGIGKLDLSNPMKPILRIGNHELEGNFVGLAKPLVVLRKRVEELTVRNGDGGRDGEAKTGGRDGEVAHKNKLEIVDVVERKLVFSKRPQPIIRL